MLFARYGRWQASTFVVRMHMQISWKTKTGGRIAITLMSGPVMWGLTRILPATANESLARGASAPLSRVVSGLSRWLPISLSEMMLALLLVGLVGSLGWRLTRGKSSRWVGLLRWGLDVLRSASALVATFYVLWGFGYGAPPLANRLHLAQIPTAARAAALEDFARLCVNRTNQAYLDLHDVADAARPTDRLPRRIAVPELRASLDALVQEFPELALAPGVRAPLKTLASGELFRRMGISGVYSPFLAEAHVVSSMPGCAWGQVLAHEMAHQRGVHREDEANFVGFLAATRAGDPALRYAGWLFAQRQALRALARIGDPQVTELLSTRLAGVQRDVDDLHEYWKVARGRTGRLATRVNHAYLRSNRVADGVASYGRSLDLLLRWQEQHAGPPIPRVNR